MHAILHIGTEKTGSTTIQAFIKKNHRALLAEGIEFLKFKGHHTSRPFVTWSLDPEHADEEIEKLRISDPDKREEWRNSFREEVDRKLSNLPDHVDRVLFSSEHFQSRLYTEHEVARLKSFLDEYFSSYSVILYLRRQDDVARSLYSTSLRTGKVPRRQLLAGKMKGPYFDYLALVERWSNVFGRDNIDVRQYGRKYFRDGDLLKDFCDACGIENFDRFVPPDEKNTALSAVAQAALLELNLHFPGRVDGKLNEFNRRLRKHCTKYLAEHHTGPTLMPARAEAIDFYETYRAGNEEMYVRYFDGKPIFKEDFSNYPEDSIDLLEVEGHREALLDAITDFKARGLMRGRGKPQNPVIRVVTLPWRKVKYRVKHWWLRKSGLDF